MDEVEAMHPSSFQVFFCFFSFCFFFVSFSSFSFEPLMRFFVSYSLPKDYARSPEWSDGLFRALGRGAEADVFSDRQQNAPGAQLQVRGAFVVVCKQFLVLMLSLV